MLNLMINFLNRDTKTINARLRLYVAVATLYFYHYRKQRNQKHSKYIGTIFRVFYSLSIRIL
ncbi:hypothetical protein QWZ13_18485 [Reinekea marina]|uniref:hypothetical protein n=1 Tax=Reinekea marina TaxID=1310421 RepID=UPI0025B4ADE3|nr:hypothetical protein [Reinekea marina]MDN3650900.1 hypothetical protein [Reinekea marina]